MTFPRQRRLTGRAAAEAAADPDCRAERLPAARPQPPDLPRPTSLDRCLTPGMLSQWARDRIAEITADEQLYTDGGRCRPQPGERASARLRHRYPAVPADRTEPSRDTAPHGHRSDAGMVHVPADALDGLLGVPPGADRDAAHTRAPEPPHVHARAATARPDLVRRLAGILSGRHCATVHALYDHSSSRWSLAWEHPEQTKLTRALLAEAAASDRELERLVAGRDHLRLGDRRLDLVVWARRMALLDSLVNPEKPITAEARAALGLTGQSFARASIWPNALPGLRCITRARALLTYNESYDCGVITEPTAEPTAEPGHRAEPSVWSCLMEVWSTRWQAHRRHRSRDGHHACSDCQDENRRGEPATRARRYWSRLKRR